MWMMCCNLRASGGKPRGLENKRLLESLRVQSPVLLPSWGSARGSSPGAVQGCAPDRPNHPTRETSHARLNHHDWKKCRDKCFPAGTQTRSVLSWSRRLHAAVGRH